VVVMWKDIALYGASSVFTYFNTREMCDKHEMMVMMYMNFILNLITLTVVLLKSPVKVIDNRVDLK
jgi:hypothetical protein